MATNSTDNKHKPHWIDQFSMRCAILYPETWAVQNKQIMQAMKYEYLTTRGLENATIEEIDRALNIWKSENQYPPKPNQLLEHVRLAKDEMARDAEKEKARYVLPQKNDYYVDPCRLERTKIQVEAFRKANPNATWLDICRASMAGKFR